jgi:hypothetical protein
MIMKTIHYILVSLAVILALTVSCTKMNDFHDEYLRNGPIIYVGRVDSMKVFPGKERVQVNYWITDPRAKELCFYWNNRKDSAKFSVPAHDPSEMQTLLVDPVAEGDYTFQVFSYDGKGHRSIRFEQAFSSYGEVYSSTLNTRSVASVTVGDGAVSVKWGSSFSALEVGIEVRYIGTDGVEKILFVPTEELMAATVIEDADLGRSLTYRTAYKPSEDAIDVFYSVEKLIQLPE